jgi:hypothetical protein
VAAGVDRERSAVASDRAAAAPPGELDVPAPPEDAAVDVVADPPELVVPDACERRMAHPPKLRHAISRLEM